MLMSYFSTDEVLSWTQNDPLRSVQWAAVRVLSDLAQQGAVSFIEGRREAGEARSFAYVDVGVRRPQWSEKREKVVRLMIWWNV